MKLISGRDILRQLKADLIGKDSYRGVTLTYSWLANQCGHFSLGYIPALMLWAVLKKFSSVIFPAFWAALIISIMWLLFELYNFLGPLLVNRTSESKILFAPGKKYTFTPSWGNIAFDTLTDVCFFGLGAFSAALFLKYSYKAAFIPAGLLLIILYPSYYWYITKMYLQGAKYPLQFRLSQWDKYINENDKNTVLQFLKEKSAGRHLLIFGAEKSGKTSLGVAIGTEMSIKHQPCSYTTAIKLYSMFFEEDEQPLNNKTNLWTWRNSALLVIDDINPGFPIKEDIVTQDMFLKMLDALQPRNESNRDTIKNKNIIWVLGSSDTEKNCINNWQLMLESIGVARKNICCINLLQADTP